MQNKYPKIKELLSLNEKNFKIFFPKDNNILEKDKISAKNNINHPLLIEVKNQNYF